MLRALLAALALCFFAPASAWALTTLDFEGLTNGVGGPFLVVAPDANVTITGSGPNLGPAAFDSDPAGPNLGGVDEDLLVDTGMVLILQSTDNPAMTGAHFDVPNDEADGGTLHFAFSNNVGLVSVDLIDINGNGPASITLFDSGGDSRIYSVPMWWTGDIEDGDPGIGTLDLNTLLPQAGVGPGNPLATVSEIGAFDEFDVVSMDIWFGGSAAVDNLSFVPEPGTIVLVGLGLVGLQLHQRRTRR